MTRVGDFFIHTRDILASRTFYSEVIGLSETFYSDKYRHVVYQLSTEPVISLVLIESKNTEDNEKWDNGPVFQEGDGYNISFTVHVDDLQSFRNIVSRLKDQYRYFYDNPVWTGYWSYIVKDPSGTTVEVYCQLDEKPESPPEWIA